MRTVNYCVHNSGKLGQLLHQIENAHTDCISNPVEFDSERPVGDGGWDDDTSDDEPPSSKGPLPHFGKKGGKARDFPSPQPIPQSAAPAALPHFGKKGGKARDFSDNESSDSGNGKGKKGKHSAEVRRL